MGALLTMWTELLGVDDIGEDDNFFDLGGHSLIAIRLMARIHRELEVRLQLATLFDAPTVSALADLIRAEKPDLEERLQGRPAPAATEPATEVAEPAPAATAVPNGAQDADPDEPRRHRHAADRRPRRLAATYCSCPRCPG